MEHFFETAVHPDDMKEIENKFNQMLDSGKVDSTVYFQYGSCLVRSDYSSDVKKGIGLLEVLFKKSNAAERRDCLYYIAIGNARIKKYLEAKRCIDEFLKIEPANTQVQELNKWVEKKMEIEEGNGFTLVTGVVATIIIGMAIIKTIKS